MKKLFFIPPLGLLLCILLLGGCKKNPEPEPDLPPETQHGADTFGCYLNGKPWKPSPRSFGNPTLYIQLDGPYFVLYAYNKDDGRNERISFFSNKVNALREGNYILKKSIVSFDNRSWFIDYKKNLDFDSTDSDTVDDGLLTITKFDTQKKFVSGRFWFKLQKGDIKYEATEGRFDISY